MQRLRTQGHGEVSAAVAKETTEGHPGYDEGSSLKAPPAAKLFLRFLFTPLWSAVTLSVLFLFIAKRIFNSFVRASSMKVPVFDWIFTISFSSPRL